MMDLAGFVVAEAILLKLCLKIREEGFGEKMQNELKYWLCWFNNWISKLTRIWNPDELAAGASVVYNLSCGLVGLNHPEYEDGYLFNGYLRLLRMDAKHRE